MMNVFHTVVAEVSPEFLKKMQENYSSTYLCGAPSLTEALGDRIRTSFPAVELILEEQNKTLSGIRMLGMWEELSTIQLVLSSWIKVGEHSFNSIDGLDFSRENFKNAECQTDPGNCDITKAAQGSPAIDKRETSAHSSDKEVENDVTKLPKPKRGRPKSQKVVATAVSLPSRKSSRVPRKKNLDDFLTSFNSNESSKVLRGPLKKKNAAADQIRHSKNSKLPSAMEDTQAESSETNKQEIEALFSATLDGNNDKSNNYDSFTVDISAMNAEDSSQSTASNTNGDSETERDEFPLFEDVAKYERLSDEHFEEVAVAGSNVKIEQDANESAVEYNCKHCSFKSSVRRNLRCHVFRNHLEKKHICKKCGKAFGLTKDLKRHMLKHNTKYTCREGDCELSFDKRSDLRKHLKKLRKNTEDQGKQLDCPKCSFTSNNAKNLSSHINRLHGEKSNSCPICPKSFALLKDLRQHLRSHSETFCCEVCGKQLRSKYGLQKHVDIIHNKIQRRPSKSYLCTTCGALCPSMTQYKIHMNREHLNIKPFHCKLCDMSFYAKANLTVHLQVHSDERKCVCNVCGKSFKQAQSLRIHKISHADVRPFKCDTCNKTFTQRGALVRHQRIHTGEKPYACKLCSSSFSDYSILRRHVLAIHKIDDHHLVRRTADEDKTKEIIESLASHIAAVDGVKEINSGNPVKRGPRKRKPKEDIPDLPTDVGNESVVHIVKSEVDVSIMNAVLDSQVSSGIRHQNITIHSNHTSMPEITELRMLPDHCDKMSIILQAAQQSLIASSLPELPSTNTVVSGMDNQLEVQAVEVLSHLHQPGPSISEHEQTSIIHIQPASLLQQALAVPMVGEASLPIMSVQEQLQNLQDSAQAELIATSHV